MHGHSNRVCDNSCYYAAKQISRTTSSAHEHLQFTYNDNCGSNWHFYYPPGLIKTERGLSDAFALEYSRETHCFASYTTRCLRPNAMCNYAKKRCILLENSLRLDDIPKWWSTNEGFVSALPIKQHKKAYDDVDFNIFNFHKESQRYNDCALLEQRYFLFLEALQEHLLTNFIRTFRITAYLIQDLFWNFTRLSLFEQMTVLGYECFVNCEKKDFDDGADAVVVKNMKNLAVCFGVESTLGEGIVAACNNHFVLCGRSRMPYTKFMNRL